jgi:hypothetical protein
MARQIGLNWEDVPVRVTVHIDEDLVAKLRAETQRSGTSFRHIFNHLLRRGMNASPTPQRAPYRCPTLSLGASSYSINKALAHASDLEDTVIHAEHGKRI